MSTVGYDVVAGRRVYTVVDDRTTVTVAAVTGQLVDETTGAGIRVAARVEGAAGTPAGVRGRSFDGGWFVLSAVDHLDLPLLATTPYTVSAVVRASGFEDLEVAYTLPAGGALPLDAGQVTLRRRPVLLRGRVTRQDTGAPVGGALVFARAAAGGTPLVALRRPLRFDHPAGTDVRRRRLLDGATLTALTAPARGGARTITVASRSGLAADAVVRVGTGDEAEHAVVASVAPEPADPAQPGDVTLTAPLYRGFAATAPVRVLDPDVVPQTRHLASDARAGDGLLLLDGAIEPDTVNTLEIPEAGLVEYHALGAHTSTDGYYRLPALGRVANLRLVTRATGLADGVRTVALAYGAATNHVNVALQP